MKNNTPILQKTTSLLHQTRMKSRLSLRQCAKLAGTSHSTILAYEKGTKVPSVVVFLKILEAYGYGVDFKLSPRIRFQDGIDRGEELANVLLLAAQFPAKTAKQLSYPKFSDKKFSYSSHQGKSGHA